MTALGLVKPIDVSVFTVPGSSSSPVKTRLPWMLGAVSSGTFSNSARVVVLHALQARDEGAGEAGHVGEAGEQRDPLQTLGAWLGALCVC